MHTYPELLELVELYAEDYYEHRRTDLVKNEEDLSERFDSFLEEYEVNSDSRFNPDDTVAINEGFSNYADALCSDGLLHPEQVHHYCYVGKYS